MSMPAANAGLESSARTVVRTLREAGFETYWAGGCVRDLQLGRPAKDIDIATQARPEQVLALFPHAHAIGRAFGVILVDVDGSSFEVATFRRDAGYSDGRRPDAVAFTNAREDAQRRDFTINGLFLDPLTGEVLDYVGGQADLRAGRIRAIGDPRARFAEDHLRLLRAVRFAGTLGFALDPATAQAMREQAHTLSRISAERIQVELIRILTESRAPGQSVLLMKDTGLLDIVLPEIAALQGVEQPPEYHPEGDVFRHTILMLDLMQKPTPELALSVLLHDIGKPATQRRVPQPDGRERIRFDGHAEVGANMAEKFLQRLRCSHALTDQVVTCVRHHMRFIDVTRMRTATLRRLVMSPTFATEMELHRLDCLGSHGHLDNYHFVQQFAQTLQNQPTRPEPWLRGHDVLAAGVPAGPEIKQWLDQAYDLQLEGQFKDAQQARDWLKAARQAKQDGSSTSTPSAPTTD